MYVILFMTVISLPLVVGKVVLNKKSNYVIQPDLIKPNPHMVRPIVGKDPRHFIEKEKVFTPTFRQGGQKLEAGARSWAFGALRGQGPISEGTAIHEATHFMQTTSLTSPIEGFCAFYLWRQNKYLIMPTTNFRKGLVLDLVPLDTVTPTNVRVYFGNYANRDAIHIIEDFVAELNGFEDDSPSLLRDMLVFSVALGLKMQQVNHEQLEQYQAGNKYLIERASKKAINLNSFRTSQNPKAQALRNYLKETYGKI